MLNDQSVQILDISSCLVLKRAGVNKKLHHRCPFILYYKWKIDQLLNHDVNHFSKEKLLWIANNNHTSKSQQMQDEGSRGLG